jgi:hypothetical protein
MIAWLPRKETKSVTDDSTSCGVQYGRQYGTRFFFGVLFSVLLHGFGPRTTLFLKRTIRGANKSFSNSSWVFIGGFIDESRGRDRLFKIKNLFCKKRG